MKNRKIMKVIAFIFIVTSGLFVIFNPVTSWGPDNGKTENSIINQFLMPLVLTTQDDILTESEVLAVGSVDLANSSHPLSHNSFSDNENFVSFEEQGIFNYTHAYNTLMVSPLKEDDERVVTVAQYLYYYPNSKHTENSAKRFVTALEEFSGKEINNYQKDPNGFVSNAFIINGSEGEFLHWYVGYKDNTLMLILVDSLGSDSDTEIASREFFNQLISSTVLAEK